MQLAQNYNVFMAFKNNIFIGASDKTEKNIHIYCKTHIFFIWFENIVSTWWWNFWTFIILNIIIVHNFINLAPSINLHTNICMKK